MVKSEQVGRELEELGFLDCKLEMLIRYPHRDVKSAD